MSYANLSSVSKNVLKFYQQLTGEERRIPFIFDNFHFSCLTNFTILNLPCKSYGYWSLQSQVQMSQFPLLRFKSYGYWSLQSQVQMSQFPLLRFKSCGSWLFEKMTLFHRFSLSYIFPIQFRIIYCLGSIEFSGKKIFSNF